jgi:hypothetical protein
MYEEGWFSVQLTGQLGITIHSAPYIYVQGLPTPRSEEVSDDEFV